jgi:hypothetical protein
MASLGGIGGFLVAVIWGFASWGRGWACTLWVRGDPQGAGVSPCCCQAVGGTFLRVSVRRGEGGRSGLMTRLKPISVV